MNNFVTKTVHRPWGHYTTLYTGKDCQVKRIVIKPGQQPSYQYHFKRDERWAIVSGYGMVRHENYGEDESGYYHVSATNNDIVEIYKEEKHTIKNTGTEDLVFIEIQTGDYFGEDDIVRLEDKYGRA